MLRCGRILCLWGSGLVEAEVASGFLSLRARLTDDDPETNTTTIASTTEAPATSTTTAASDTGATDEPRSLVIRGAGGDSADIVNGRYKVAGKVNGRRSWQKIMDPQIWMVFLQNASGASQGAWYITLTEWKDMENKEGGWMRGECDGNCLPTEVESWLVTKDDRIWTPEPAVSIASLDESFGSDWLAPTLTAFAAFMALAAASAGAGSLQKGSELCSMSGTWLDDTERYSVTATPPSFAPPVVLSLLRVAFPVPIPGGDVQLTLQQTSSPDVCMEFQQASQERSIQQASRDRSSKALIWQSDEGATIRRLGRDSAEFTPPGPPGLEPRLLCRVPNNNRSKMLPATWLLLACIWFRPPVTMPMAGLFIALGPAQMAVSFVAACIGGRCSLPGVQQLLPWAWVLRAVAAAMPLLCLLVLDYYSQTLSGSVIALAVITLHALSFMGPSLLSARADLLSAAGLAGGVVAALVSIFVFVGALLCFDIAWAFDRSKATVALACLGSWMAVPMQIGDHPTEQLVQRIVSKATLVSKSPLLEGKQDGTSFAETDDNVEAAAQSEGSAEESVTSSERIGESSVSLQIGDHSNETPAQRIAIKTTLVPKSPLLEGEQHGTSFAETDDDVEAGTQSEGSAEESVSSCERIGEASVPRASCGKKANQKESTDSVSTRATLLSASAASSMQDSSVTTQQSLLRMTSQPSVISAASTMSATVHAAQLQIDPAATSEVMLDTVPMKRKRKHAMARKAHKSVPSSEGVVADVNNLPKKKSERSVCSTSLCESVAAPSTRDCSLSSGQSQSVSVSSVTTSIRSQTPRSVSNGPTVRAAPGDRFMFVNRSGHEYDGRCQEYEIVMVVKVGGNPLVKVQWQNGFIQRVRMEDLSEMPSLPTAERSSDIPDMLGDSDRGLSRSARPINKRTSRSSSRRAIRRMPDMPVF